MAKKYGDEKTGILFKKMLQGYKRLVFIDTGNYELERYRIRSQEIAQRLDLRYGEVKGDNSLVKKLLNGPWDEDFVVAPLGHTVALDDFRNIYTFTIAGISSFTNEMPCIRSPGIPDTSVVLPVGGPSRHEILHDHRVYYGVWQMPYRERNSPYIHRIRRLKWVSMRNNVWDEDNGLEEKPKQFRSLHRCSESMLFSAPFVRPNRES